MFFFSSFHVLFFIIIFISFCNLYAFSRSFVRSSSRSFAFFSSKELIAFAFKAINEKTISYSVNWFHTRDHEWKHWVIKKQLCSIINSMLIKIIINSMSNFRAREWAMRRRF
jgi:hypothetical protein